MRAYEVTNAPTSVVELLVLRLFIIQICWAVCMWIVKCSILAFYWRLFSDRHRSVRVVIWTVAAGVTCWEVAVV